MARSIGVCSWSLQPSSPADLVAKCRDVGATAVQLALGPERHNGAPVERMAAALREADVAIRHGMSEMKGEDYSTLGSIRRTGGVRPDATWSDNVEIARRHAHAASELGLTLVTFHAGFMPHDRRDPERAKLVDRLRKLVDIYADFGVRVGFETGQETAETLLDVLAELGRSTVGVNFDPANMILYGMGDPIDAFRKLAPHVLAVHIKDARPAAAPGAWGDQTPIGAGAVDWPAFFGVLHELQIDVDLMIEREAGGNRIAEVREALRFVARLLEEHA